MKPTTARTWIAAACVAALGCKEPARAVAPATKPAAAPDAQTPPPAPEAPPAETSKQSCGADHQREDSRSLIEAEKMRPIMEKVMVHGALPGILDAISDVARRKAFTELDGLIKEQLAGIERVNPGLAGVVRPVLEKAVRVRVGAYATCMSLAEDDISWCTGQDASWQGERQACQVMHTVHRRIALGVIQKGGDCASVMEGSPEVYGIDGAKWVEVCEAFRDMKPDGCPPGLDAGVAAMCRAAAARSGHEHCKVEEGVHSALWEPCCSKFAYRLAVVATGKADPGLIPEQGALDGDRDGCERALAWGLFQDLAWLFGIEGVPGSPIETSDTDDYLCRFQIYNSPQELPGR